jgi:predicted amidohydrolase YtcJ
MDTEKTKASPDEARREFPRLFRATPSNKRFEPDHAMPIQEALRAHTMGAAYAGHEEKTKGSIEPCKLADFAVWGADPMTATPTKMLTIPIVMTIIGGKIVYQA